MDQFAIHRASEEGDLERVRQLIEGGVSVDSRDDEGCTPLHWAARRGCHAVAELLVSSKCDHNLKDRSGRTPVLVAAESGNRSMVTLLLQRGVQVHCADDDKWTLLHHASENGWTDQVKYILDRGEADVNAETGIGGTPLVWAAGGRHGDVAVLLFRAGADVHRKNSEKMTALHLAAFYGHARVVQALLEKEGLDLNPQDDDSWTPLHCACYWGHQEVFTQLLVAGADSTLKDNNGDTALSGGIRRGKLTLEDIRLFVQKGAFLQKCDYLRISEDPVLKENILKDVGLCTQSIVNKFHRQSLPALKSISYFARQLPNIDNFKLNARQVEEVENLVRCEIGRNTFCNVVKVRPMALSALCVLSLTTCQPATERSDSSDSGSSDSNSSEW